MNKKIIIAFIPAITFALVIAPILLIANAQETVTQKSFFFGENPNDVLANRTYTNGEEISYSLSGYPSVVVTIDRWNEVPLVERTLIRTALLTEGYEEQPEVITNTGQTIESASEILRGN